MQDHKIWQECWAELEHKSREERKGQIHPQTPEHEAAVKDQGQEHMLCAQKEGGDEPGQPTILELRCKTGHNVTEIGR